jgi:hypothetical protein
MRALAGATSVTCLGWRGAGPKALPYRVVRAARLGNYPGRLVPMGEMTRLSKWSG